MTRTFLPIFILFAAGTCHLTAQNDIGQGLKIAGVRDMSRVRVQFPKKGPAPSQGERRRDVPEKGTPKKSGFSATLSASAAKRQHSDAQAPHMSDFWDFLQKIHASTGSVQTSHQAVRTATSVAYHAAVVPITGWMEGTGTPLTESEARHRPLAFRLSQPDADGHWQQVEALAYGRPTPAHGITSPLTDCYAATVEAQRWQQTLAAVTTWRLTADPDGQLAVIRAFTATDSLAYTLHATAATDGTPARVCFFTDSQGLVVDVGPDTLYTYGSTFRILTDSLGRDSLVTFMDAQGYLKPRPDGVWQLRYTYTGLRLASETALDMAARPMRRRVAPGQQPFCIRRFMPDDKR